jgi:dynein assembly factor 3
MFKERYDYRANLIDWDFNMMLTECAPIVHFYHYKEWRLTGLAYEQRFSKYTEPNRTLSSYADGKKKQEKTSCLVRGFWGDIMMSPYIALGTKCDSKQSDLLFKKANYKYIGHSV